MLLEGIEPSLPPYQRGILPLNYKSEFGRGYWDRTSDDRVKVCSVTATLTPNRMVAEEGIEPPTPAYETGKIPFLYSAIKITI